MEGFKLTLKPQPQWVALDDPMFDVSEFNVFPKAQRAQLGMLIAPLSPMELADIRKRHTSEKVETRFTNGVRNTQPVDKIDTEAAGRETLERMLLDWRGFIGDDDQPIKCTPENRKAFVDVYPKTFMCVSRISSDIATRQNLEANKDREEQRKNSSASQDGDAGKKED